LPTQLRSDRPGRAGDQDSLSGEEPKDRPLVDRHLFALQNVRRLEDAKLSRRDLPRGEFRKIRDDPDVRQPGLPSERNGLSDNSRRSRRHRNEQGRDLIALGQLWHVTPRSEDGHAVYDGPLLVWVIVKEPNDANVGALLLIESVNKLRAGVTRADDECAWALHGASCGPAR